MSRVVVICYEIVYAIIYFGLLFSKNAFLKYYPDVSFIEKLLLLLLLFSGFFVPYILKLLRVRLTLIHYSAAGALFCAAYLFASGQYYAAQFRERAFHSFLQVPPFEQTAEVRKSPGVFRIVCLGGSTTEGLGRKGYPDSLRDLLVSRYPRKRIEVINAGRFFYSTQHSIIQYLFYLKDFDPDLIIFFHAINDLITSFTEPPFSSRPFRRDYGHFYGALAHLRYPKSFEQILAGFFYADLMRTRTTPAPFSDFKSQHSFRRNLETMIEIAQSRRIHVILANQPHCFSARNDSDPGFLIFRNDFLIDEGHYADEQSWYNGMELFNGITGETAVRHAVPLVDQAAVCNGRKELFSDSVHMNAEGTARQARLFCEKIVELHLLE